MKYPKFTIIMRSYNKEQAFKIARNVIEYNNDFAIEVTLNTPNALEIIKELNDEYGDVLKIGAGTVRNKNEASAAMEAKAKFLLGPHIFEKEIFEIAKKNNVLTIPGAFSPSEIVSQFEMGADIVKVFPANALGSKFFSDIQGPLGSLNLMAVGGVGPSNYMDYLNNGASFVGIGSSLFDGATVDELSDFEIQNALKQYIEKI